MIYCFDLDGVICFTKNTDYENATPNFKVINHVNKLYNENNEIVIYTARGTKSKIDWRELTEKQLKQWHVSYHELKFNKIVYDFWIDDKCINVSDLNL